jgi:carbonic anhydrase
MTLRKAEIALQEILEGNQRYMAGRLTHPRQTIQRRQELAQHQEPFAIILGCADSRVPPELIFDQGLGDLFVVRVAGNIPDEAAVMGSLEYAVAHLRTPLLVVLGHKGCGAVKATVEVLAAHESGEGHLGFIVNAIRPAIDEARRAGGDLLDQAIRVNVERTVNRLKETEPILAGRVHSQELMIVGAYYDLESGRVEILGEAG